MKLYTRLRTFRQQGIGYCNHQSLVVPSALHLHLLHYLTDTSVYVPQRRIARHRDGDMVYWFHLKAHLPEWARWLTFIQRRPASCYVTDVPSAEATRDPKHCHRWFVLQYGTGVHRYSAGYTNCDPTPCQLVFLSGGARGATICRVVAIWYIRITQTRDYGCCPDEGGLLSCFAC